VVNFDEPTPGDLIAAVQPDVLVKGADWPESSMIGREIVEARGGRVVRVPFEAGYSTTRIIEKVKAQT
jgi:bifunctional ADP-heptose synthase (sugar kinase/adenylyltransferase)